MCCGTSRLRRGRRGRAPVHSRALVLGLALTAVPGLAGELVAQQRPASAQPGGARASAEVTLVYDREVFTYPGADRRDPFLPLTDENEMGPRFESLTLQGIVFSTGPRSSVALLAGSDGRIYRVRVGDVVGNSTVVEIGPLRVVMAVENFGTIRQEMLELPGKQGANR